MPAMQTYAGRNALQWREDHTLWVVTLGRLRADLHVDNYER